MSSCPQILELRRVKSNQFSALEINYKYLILKNCLRLFVALVVQINIKKKKSWWKMIFVYVSPALRAYRVKSIWCFLH